MPRNVGFYANLHLPGLWLWEPTLGLYSVKGVPSKDCMP